MSTLSCLHFTDLHRGQDWYHNCIFPNVQEMLIEDLKRLYEKTGPWDLILFSGDLVQSGGGKDDEEFKLLTDTLRELWDEFTKLGPPPHLLTIPGNHDLVFPDARRSAVKTLGRWGKEKDVQKEFWTDAKSEYRQVVVEAFQGYATWESAQTFRSCSVTPGLLPGDFAATIDKDGWQIGVIGLNSAFLQLSPTNFEGRLALHPAQLQAMCGKNYVTWFKRHHLCLLMTHHPPEWLNAEARGELEANIAPTGRFALHLCGHLHLGWSESVKRGGETAPLLLRGGALFGLKHYHRNKQRLHGYSVLQFELSDGKAQLRRWPRMALPTSAHRWILVRNEAEQLEDDGGTAPEEVALRTLPARTAAREVPSPGQFLPQPTPQVVLSAPTAPRTPAALTDVGDEPEKLRRAFNQALEAAHLLTSHVWERARSYVVFEGQTIEMQVGVAGDALIRGIYVVRSSQPVQFVPYEIVADEVSAPLAHLEDAEFTVSPLGKKGESAFYLQTENLPYRKRCAIVFIPEILPGSERRLEVRYRWPRAFAKLIDEGNDELFFEWRRPVETGRVTLRFAPELGEVRCQVLRGKERGGRLRRSHDAAGNLVWTFSCRKAPAGDYLLLLEKGNL